MKKFLAGHARWLATILACVLLFSTPALAQNSSRTGTVVDEKGAPLPGVSILVKGTKTGTTTDATGHFTIQAPNSAILIFSYIQYATKEVAVGNQKTIDVNLAPTAANVNEVVVVGYGTQKKVSMTGAVSSVNAQEIVTTKNENVENMLTGKVPGLQIVQNTAEPGDFANNINIRGMGNPLIVIDGVEQPDFPITQNSGDNNVGSSNIFTRLDPNDIESVSVLKDASASVYGVKAANGVILITTKRGHSGQLSLSYSGTYGWQVPSGLPKPVDAVQYMELVNEQALHTPNGGIPVYTDAQIKQYQDGTLKSTDWYDAVFKKSAAQQQHNLTATGGNEIASYLLSAGYTDQDGFLQSNALNYKRYNVRANVTSKIGKRFTVNLNLSGIMDTKNAPSESFWWITRETWRELPTQTIYANNNPAYLNNGIVDGGNPVAFMDPNIVGYSTLNNKWFSGSISVDYKFPFIDGLTARAFFSYNYQLQDNKLFQKSFNLYTYNAANQTYNATLNNSPSYVQRQFYEYPQNTDQLSLNYQHTFADAHNVGAMVLLEGNAQSADNFAAYRQLAIPVDQIIAGNSANQNATQDGGNTALYSYATNSVVGRVTYDFKTRYLAEFSFRTDESSKFAPGQKYGFFPAGQLGYRISDEPFFKNVHALNFIDNLKLRGTYGVLGDDGSLYFQFLNGYTYPASGSNNQLPGGAVFGGSYINSVQSTGIPNPKVSWMTSHTLDVGLDLDAWNGLLGFSGDFFIRNRSGILAASTLTVPEVLGASLPEENLNGDRTSGIDFEIDHRNHIGKFNYNVKATFSYARTRNTVVAESPQGNSYLDWLYQSANRNQGIQWGYGAAGQYQNYQQIINSPVYVGRGTTVGDYIYQDWNGDGQIDGNDIHPIAYGGTPNGGPGTQPLITYGVNIGGSYQGFDANLLFQGSAIYSVSYIEQLNIPLWGGGSALTYFTNNYHPVNPTADPYNPNTQWASGSYAYTGTTAMTNSSFNFQNASYLRLKAAELGYSLSPQLLRKTGIKGIRFYVTGYNLFTITKVKYLDPEHPSGTYGYLYPLDKLYSFGLNLKF